MKIGYARVSSSTQSLDLQIDALKSYGCDRLYLDKGSTRGQLPSRDKVMELVEAGDTLVVWKLDRFGRSTAKLVTDIMSLVDRGVYFVSLQDKIDTSSAVGRFQLAVFSAVAELERDLIRERTLAGLSAARARGRVGGRPRGVSKGVLKKILIVSDLIANGYNVSESCKLAGVAKSTYYKYLREEQTAD